MSEMLGLADFKGLDEAAVKEHIAGEYGGDKSGFDYGKPSDADREKLASELESFRILIAYESVGSWGCDSSSFFLLEKDGKLFENHGGHCSCYGFEGQWAPEETSKESLLKRQFWGMGGYDNESEANTAAIRSYIEALPE